MNHFLSKPALPKTEQDRVKGKRDVAKLPNRQDDALKNYVVGVRGEFDYVQKIDLLGITFHHHVISAEASYVHNADKNFPPGYSVLALTDKQVSALWKRAEITELHVPRRYNWERAAEGAEEYFPPQTLFAKDIIYITPVDEFNPVALNIPSIPEPEFRTESEKISEQIITAQGKRGKGK